MEAEHNKVEKRILNSKTIKSGRIGNLGFYEAIVSELGRIVVQKRRLCTCFSKDEEIERLNNA